MGLRGAWRVLAIALKHDADPLRSPCASASSEHSLLIESARDLAKRKAIGAHRLDLAQDRLLALQWYQDAPASLISLIAQLVAIGRMPEPHTLSLQVLERIACSLRNQFSFELRTCPGLVDIGNPRT